VNKGEYKSTHFLFVACLSLTLCFWYNDDIAYLWYKTLNVILYYAIFTLLSSPFFTGFSLLCITVLFHYIKQAVRVATQYASAPLPLSAPSAPPSRRNVAVLSHAEYVPTLTAAATLRVKAALSKAAWWPWPLTFWPFDLESGVRVTCDVGYLYANFGLPRPLCSRVTPDVRDRQTTDVIQKHRLMPRQLGAGHNNQLVS